VGEWEAHNWRSEYSTKNVIDHQLSDDLDQDADTGTEKARKQQKHRGNGQDGYKIDSTKNSRTRVTNQRGGLTSFATRRNVLAVVAILIMGRPIVALGIGIACTINVLRNEISALAKRFVFG
jgi:hypothetical protein